MLAAVAIETTADLQLDRFIAAAGSGGSMKGICTRGLWGESDLHCDLTTPLASQCTTTSTYTQEGRAADTCMVS